MESKIEMRESRKNRHCEEGEEWFLRSKSKTIRWIVLNDERPKHKRRADRRGNPKKFSVADMDCHVALKRSSQ